jgi:hypothetical protein
VAHCGVMQMAQAKMTQMVASNARRCPFPGGERERPRHLVVLVLLLAISAA